MTTSGDLGTSYRRTYAHSTKSVGPARREVVEFARAVGFCEQGLDDIEVAVGEALANAVEHGRQADRGVLEVSAHRNEHSLVVEIKDDGKGFDHSGQCHPVRPPAESLRGFGSFIMGELMDEMVYSDGGTRLRLVKHLPAAAERATA